MSLCVCQSAPVCALVVPVCCERGLYLKNSKIRSGTGRTSAVPQCFQPARLSFLNWLEFCLVERRIAPPRGPGQPRSKPGSPARSRGGAGCHRCPGAPSGGGGPPRPPPVPLPPAARRQRRRPPLHQRWRDGCRRGAGRCRAQRVPPDRPTRARRSLRRPRRAEHPRVASRRIGEQRKLLASPLGSAAAPAAFSDLKPTLSADRSI